MHYSICIKVTLSRKLPNKKASLHSFFVFAVVFEVMHFGGGWWESFTQEFIKVLNIYHYIFTHNSYFEIIILFTIYVHIFSLIISFTNSIFGTSSIYTYYFHSLMHTFLDLFNNYLLFIRTFIIFISKNQVMPLMHFSF